MLWYFAVIRRTLPCISLLILSMLLSQSRPMFAQIVPPADGVPLPAHYLKMRADNPDVFQFERAWIGLVKQIKENRRRYLRGEISLEAANTRGGIRMAGNRYVPVLTGKFANTGANPYPAADLQQELFDGPWPTGTMSQYYAEISYGAINLTGTVTNWVTVSQNDTYYEGTSNGLNPANAETGEFLKELLDANDGSIDFGQYDNDGPDGIPNSGDDDGYADFVAFVHPESGGECGNDNLWSHRWTYSAWWGSPYLTNDASANGGVIRVQDYVIQPGFNCDGATMIQIGVFCHEFGHAFGLPDLYDTDGSSEGIGHWGLMAAGNWNSPALPAHMSPWSKTELGWIIPTEVTPSGNITDLHQLPLEAAQSLPNVEFNASVLKVYATATPGSEYFLIENRQALGFDGALHGSGLLIWHIDDAKSNNRSEWYPPLNPANHYMVALEQADGDWDLEKDNNRGDSGDAFTAQNFDCYSTPSSDAYTAGSIDLAIANISASGDPMTFEVTACQLPPDIGVSPLSLSVTLNEGQSSNETLTITNSGDAPLAFELVELPVSGATAQPSGLAQRLPVFESLIESGAAPPQLFSSGLMQPPALPSGGAPPTALEALALNDSIRYDTYPSTYSNIGFGSANPFYAAVRFTPTVDFDLTHVRARYNTASSTADIEVIVYADNGGLPGTVLHSQTFSGAPYLSSITHTVLFELSLALPFRAGNDFWIAMHYLDVPYPQAATTTSVGSANRIYYSSNGNNWYNLQNSPSFPNHAWIIRALSGDMPWLSLSPEDGSVSGGSSQDITVAFDATGLNAGTYSGKIQVHSNDPTSPLVTVPVTLMVQAPPVVNLKAFLEGPANPAATAMNTYLGDNSLLPQQQPYSAAPWSYSGSESVTAMPSGVVDWVLLTLRTASGAETEVAARAALLKGDGSITDTDGSSPVRFPEILAGDYYICLYQRNHLGIMSKLPVSLSSSSALYDFSLGQDQAYGINPLKELSATVFALRSGDGNADGGVDVLDKNLIWRPQNGNPWAYGNYGDFNLDGGIDVLDLNLKWRPDNGTGSQIPN